MAPKRSTKSSSGLSQPRLSFQSQRRTSVDPKTLKSKSQAQTQAQIENEPQLQRGSTFATSIDTVSGKSGSTIINVEDEEEEEKLKDKSVETAKNVAGKHLDVKSKEWDGLIKDAKVAMGGLKPIHASAETHNNIHHVLRVFDMTTKYGPLVGQTRLERWERAHKLGLNPPLEIKEILMTIEGKTDLAYKENVLYGWV